MESVVHPSAVVSHVFVKHLKGVDVHVVIRGVSRLVYVDPIALIEKLSGVWVTSGEE